MSGAPLLPGWLSRQTVPDMYPRASDPYKPPAAPGGECQPCPPGTEPLYDRFDITLPGERPRTVQRAVNMQVVVPVFPGTIPITNNRFECDSMVLDVPSTAGASVFLGYGSGVSATNGLEIQFGQPILIEPENTREMWELQRAMEYLSALLAVSMGYPPLPQYRAPRVVFNASEWFLTTNAVGAVTMSVILFQIPSSQ